MQCLYNDLWSAVVRMKVSQESVFSWGLEKDMSAEEKERDNIRPNVFIAESSFKRTYQEKMHVLA